VTLLLFVGVQLPHRGTGHAIMWGDSNVIMINTTSSSCPGQ